VGRGILFPVMLVAFLAPAVQISIERYGLPLPQIAYANALWQIRAWRRRCSSRISPTRPS
jgi:cation/acetate symporter